MSREEISVDKLIDTQEKKYINNNNNNPKLSGRVDINTLMSRVRAEEKKQKKEYLVFVGLIGSVILITGIIASL